jgi:antitoxin component YwqK of YwqJK toxin-antitoxin module
MKLKHLILFIAFFKYADVFAQAEDTKFFSHTKEGYTQFFYDEQYYLVDEQCTFRHYTRVIKQVKGKNSFDGFFTDYYNNNAIALTGTYNKGIKEGVFKNYYYNGKLKSEVTFVNDQPEGIALYYYDNGTPWMIINHQNSKVLITDYWDPYGVKKVTEGKGRFEYRDWYWGYNDTGFNAVVYRGRLRDGLPTGSWNISLSYPRSPEELISIESFEKGKFINSYNIRNPYYPTKASNLKFYPPFVDARSQKFISKQCGIDDNQDFTNYLENFLNRNFDFSIIPKSDTPQLLTCEVVVDENGRAFSVNILEGEPGPVNNLLKTLLNLIPYWIPSFIEGKTVPDKLTIQFSLNAQQAEKRFENFSISREEENQ